jgi:hypothetical protein
VSEKSNQRSWQLTTTLFTFHGKGKIDAWLLKKSLSIPYCLIVIGALKPDSSVGMELEDQAKWSAQAAIPEQWMTDLT